MAARGTVRGKRPDSASSKASAKKTTKKTLKGLPDDKRNGGGKPTVRTPLARTRFLTALANHGVVGRSCKYAGISTSAAYDWRNDDADFAQEWDDARDRAEGDIEHEAVRRAVHGIPKGIYHQGILMNVETEYSDHLMSKLLNRIDAGRAVREGRSLAHGGVLRVRGKLGETEWEAEYAPPVPPEGAP